MFSLVCLSLAEIIFYFNIIFNMSTFYAASANPNQ